MQNSTTAERFRSSCHDLITLKLLHFLIYENDIAIFGSAEIPADIDIYNRSR